MYPTQVYNMTCQSNKGGGHVKRVWKTNGEKTKKERQTSGKESEQERIRKKTSKLGAGLHTYNPSTQKTEAGDKQFEASLNYIMRPF